MKLSASVVFRYLVILVSAVQAGARPPEERKPASPAALPAAVKEGELRGLRKLSGMPLRDTSICRGPDGTWYLTGTVPPFWDYNEGIKVWKSRDMAVWEPLGMVWRYGASPWHKKYLEAKKPLWAPEVHYLKSTFWLTYSLPGWDGTGKTSGCGLLKSTSGKADGPYVDVQPAERMGDEIDASLFQDDDGAVYFVWHSGKIARMKDDMSGLAEGCHWLKTTGADPDPLHHSALCAGIFGKDSFDHVGYEGAFLFKAQGRYFLACSESWDGRYSCSVATAERIYGPYSRRYEAIPHGGHNTFFKDEQGNWWATYFGSDDKAPWQEKPGILPVRIEPSGRIRPASAQPASAPATDRPGANADRRSSLQAQAGDLFWTKDAVALRQEVDTFTSLEDGQPAGPGDWEMQLQGGWGTWSHAHDPALLEPGLKYTPHRYGVAGAHFLENMQLRLRMPFVLGTGEVTQNGDLDFGWQQRWIKECGAWPTFSTLAEIRMPTRDGSSGVDGTFTGILAKSFGPGTAYANGWVRTANGDDIEDVRHFQWGLRGGYKLPVNDWASVVAVYSHSSSVVEGHANANVLELGASFRTEHHLAFGPGVFVGMDDHAETPNFGVGFRLIYLFNARDNPTPEQMTDLRRERGE